MRFGMSAMVGCDNEQSPVDDTGLDAGIDYGFDDRVNIGQLLLHHPAISFSESCDSRYV